MPKLPQPPQETDDVRISYFREKEAVWRLAEELLPDLADLREGQVPRAVGEASFDFAYRRKTSSPDEQTDDR